MHSVSSQSDIANHWPGMHNTAFWSLSWIQVNQDRFDNIAVIFHLLESSQTRQMQTWRGCVSCLQPQKPKENSAKLNKVKENTAHTSLDQV